MKKSLCALLTTILFSVTNFASQSKIVSIEGRIKSFDSSSLKVATAKGVVEIPRKFIQSKVKLKVDDNIKIPLTEEQLSALK